MTPVARWSLVAMMILTTSCRYDAAEEPKPSEEPRAHGELSDHASAMTVTVASAVAVPAASLSGEVAIADNFDTMSGLAKTTYTWGNPPGTPPIATDAVASQRMFCTAGQLLYDDPIVYPGQAGASHLHQFFGNTGANASSTYQKLRSSGGTTCGDAATPINRSAYWIPAMLDGRGNAIKFDWVKLYYKRMPTYLPGTTTPNPDCQYTGIQPSVGQCIDLPHGLRYVFGFNMATGKNGPTDVNSPEYHALGYSCTAGGGGRTLDAVENCPIGAQIIIHATAPDCWDGVNLDSPDHRSHMSYGTVPGPMQAGCPLSHKYRIPTLSVMIAYTVDANVRTWLLSSDAMHNSVHGSTLHMDYWEAWSPSAKTMWHRACMDKKLDCASGDMGNGYFIKGAGEITGTNPNRLVPMPPKPTTTTEPPPPPPPTEPTPTPTPTPTTKVCPDGTVILSTSTCPRKVRRPRR